MLTSVAAPVSAAQQDAWGNARVYMIEELREAQSIGLIPGIIEGADFTRPVTRAEFAHIIVLLCETFTGVSTQPLNRNPFTDTDDPVAFKAYSFGIMDGTDELSALFSPDDPIDRETMAFMFCRAIRMVAPLADYSVDRAPDIPDKAQISAWAAPSVSYLYSRGIIIGANNSKFMPKPVTAAQIRSNYGVATREQCVVIAKRLYKAFPEIAGSRFSITDKAAAVMSYAADEPQGGDELSRDELADILRPYAAKVRWADNMTATSFLGDFHKTGDEWVRGYDSAFMYNAFSSKGTSQFKFDEEQALWGVSAGNSRYSLSIFNADQQRISTYLWNSVSDTGTKQGALLENISFFSPLSLTAYMPGRLNWIYKMYDDEIIDGELCKVFSATYMQHTIEEDEPAGLQSGFSPGTSSDFIPGSIRDSSPGIGPGSSRDAPPGGPPPEIEMTDYYYISTVSGLCVVQKNYATSGGTTFQAIQIVFSISPSLTDASLIEPPPDIEFIQS